MKIDFVISSLKGGGAERVLSVIANSFAERTHCEITIITLLDDNCAYHINDAITRVSLTKKKKIIGHTIGSIFNLIRHYKSKQNRPDIVISFLTLNNLISILAAKLYGIKVMAQEHTNHHRNMKGRKYISLFTKTFIYKWADIVTVLTSYDVDFYKSRGINPTVLPNPCSFKPVSEVSKKRQNVILAIGSLDRYHIKGFDNLLTLMTPILHKHKDWTLKIVGSGDTGLKVLRKMALDNNIVNQVEFTGFVNDIPTLMQTAPIFVLSSRTEGLPMALIEAMSQGVTCIAYDCVTGPSDIIEHNINGLLIKDQDQLDMQKGIEKLINDENLRTKLAANGLTSINKYKIPHIMDLYENIFSQLN